MNRRAFVRVIGGVGLLLASPEARAAKAKRARKRGKHRAPVSKEREPEGNWQELWNGVDLTGFTAALPGAAKAPATPVFSVVQEGGRSLLRVSGEVFGALTTNTPLSNYHLRLEWKWGAEKFAPRAHLRRSTGLVLHTLPARAPFGAAKPWATGVELELQEGSCGDLWLGDGVRADVPARRERFMGQPLYVFAAAHVPEILPQPQVEPRVVKSNDYERSYGEWNVAEAYMFEQEGAFLINGSLTMQFRDLRTADGEEPLTEGSVQILSEGAEVFLRRLAVRPIDKMPDRYHIRHARG